MSWNHRVVVTEDGTHQVAEVYYEEDGTPKAWGMTVNLKEFQAGNSEDVIGVEDPYKDLLWVAREVIKAFYKPVLYVRNGVLTEEEVAS
jgi:hypothetical protein